jgi:hypothetical protein
MIVVAVALTLAFSISPQDAAPIAQAQPAQAQAQAQAPTAQAGGRDDPNRQICRREAASVGSNRGRRVCAPAWQWEQARQDSREALRRNDQGSATRPAMTVGGDAPPGRAF